VNEILRRGIYWDKSIFYSKSIKDIIKKMVTIYEKNMKMLERKKGTINMHYVYVRDERYM